ncbi:MAG TPA: hypothetical protein VNH38_06150 [Candidatus Dormibacteraeota bacterium]|nr:hypothetical protein [Candidatus Dormibacteraeota bacterium]
MTRATGRLISLEMLWGGVEDRAAHPFAIPALASLSVGALDRR